MSKVERIKPELRKLSHAELCEIRDWIDDLVEDDLELTPEFEELIRRGQRDLVEGRIARVRRP